MSLSSLRQLVSRAELRASLKLAGPLMLAEVGWSAMGIVDTMFVGRLPNSAEAVGAAGLGSILFFTVAMFGAGILLALDALVSQAFGAGRLDECRHLLLNGVYLAVLLTPPLMLVMLLLIAVLPHFGIHPAVMAQMEPFLKALNWSMLPLLLYFAFRRYLQSMNLVAVITWTLISANVINALGNWVLIYGNLGAPAMGIRGSAWATVIARIYIFVVLAGYAAWHYHRHRRAADARLRWMPDWSTMGNIVRLGLPVAFQILFEVMIFALAGTLIGKLDPKALAAHEIALLAASTTFMVPLGVSSAAAVRVGQAIGRRDLLGMRQAGWTGVLIGVAFMMTAATAFILAGRQIVAAFTPDAAVIAIGARLLLIAGFFQLFDGAQIVLSGVLRGAGETRIPMFTTTGAYWLVGLPLGWWLCFRAGYGAAGIWWGFLVALAIVASILGITWRRRSRELPEMA